MVKEFKMEVKAEIINNDLMNIFLRPVIQTHLVKDRKGMAKVGEIFSS